jgi:hypothetical protein
VLKNVLSALARLGSTTIFHKFSGTTDKVTSNTTDFALDSLVQRPVKLRPMRITIKNALRLDN